MAADVVEGPDDAVTAADDDDRLAIDLGDDVAACVGQVGLARDQNWLRQETGIRFWGSTNGIGTTVAWRSPHSLATSSRVPSATSGDGTQQ